MEESFLELTNVLVSVAEYFITEYFGHRITIIAPFD